MADQDKIIADDLLGDDVVKRFDDLNKKLIELLGTMSELSKSSIKLSDELKNQKATTESISAATEKVSQNKKKLTDAEKEAIKTEQLLQKYIDAQVGSINELNAKNKILIQERNKFSTATKEGRKEIAEINKQLDKNTETIKKNVSASEKQRMTIGDYTHALDKIIPGSGAFIDNLKGMTKAALAFIATPLGLILTGIVLVVKAVVSAFKNSEEGQNRLTKITTVLGAVFQGLVNVLAKIGDIIITAFTKPREAIDWFKTAINDIGEFFKNTFGNLIVGLVEGAAARMGKAFAFIGLAWQKVKGWFTDNEAGIKKAQDSIDEYSKKIQESNDKISEGWGDVKKAAADAFNGMKDAASDFIAEEKRRADAAAKWADMDAARKKNERKDLVEFAKDEVQINAMRAKAEELKKSNAEESIALTQKAMELERKKLQDGVDDAKRDLSMWQLRGQFQKKDTEYYDELARLQADVYSKEAAFDEHKRGRLRQLNRLRMEAFTQEKDRLKVELDANKNVIDSVISYNQQLIDDESSTYEKRLNAAMTIASQKISLAEKETELEITQTKKQIELKLLSEKDGAAQLAKLESDKNKKIYDSDLELDKSIKSIQAKRLTDLEQQSQQEINILTDKYLNQEISAQELADETIKIQVKSVEDQLLLANLTVDQKMALEEKLHSLKMSLLDKEKAKQEEIYNASIELANSLFSFQSQMYENQTSDLEAQKQYELELAGDNTAAKERIDKEYAKKLLDIRKKQAQNDKNQALFNAIVNTAVGVTKALETSGPAGIVLGLLVAAAGAVQIATIQSKPLPKYAKGIHHGFAGGPVEVGEAGYEAVKLPNGQVFLTPDKATKMILPKGAEIFTHNETKEMLNGGATPEKWDEMIKEQKETRKALSNKVEHHTSITDGGMKYVVKKTNSSIEYIDKYFRT